MNAPVLHALDTDTPAANDGGKQECLLWQVRCLHEFARVEQAVAITLNSFAHNAETDASKRANLLVERLKASDSAECKKLVDLLSSWIRRKTVRNMLAHGTLHILRNEQSECVVVLRHIGVNQFYDYADRMWAPDERNDLLRSLKAEAQSIDKRLKNIMENKALMKALQT